MLVRNDIYKSDAGHLMRVIELSPEEGYAWVFPIGKSKGLPTRAGILDLPKSPVQDGTDYLQPRELTGKTLQRAKSALAKIAPLLADRGIYSPSNRHQLIQLRATELCCSPQTLMKHLRLYWEKGQTLTALAGNFMNCGKATGSVSNRRRGRKPQYLTHDSFLITDQDKKHMETMIRRHYLKADHISAAATHQRLREKFYSYADGNGERFLLPAGQYPSLRQFRYFLRSHFSIEERLRARLSDREFELNHRARLGSSMDDCLGIGHIYEIDATIADVYLVARRSRSTIIGKPTLYLVYDKFSRLVVGFYIGLEHPSWPAAMLAISSIAEDKESLCARHGIPYDPRDWPAHGAFPQAFMADRGEMLSKNSSLLAENLQITVKNAAAFRGDRKGTVECGFKLIQRSMADAVPGYEPPENAMKRRGRQYDQDACLNLEEFTANVLAIIISHNRSVMKGYPATAEMLCQGVRTTPIEIWNHNLAHRAGSLTRFPESLVRRSLLPRGKATVTRNGIKFKDCYYSCSEAIEQGWFVKAGQREYRIDVSYDLRLTDSIYLHSDQFPGNYLEATLTSRSLDYKGLSFEEVAAYEYRRRVAKEAAIDHNANEKFAAHQIADPICENAHKEMKRVVKGKSRKARRADVANERTIERRERRQESRSEEYKSQPQTSANVIALPFKDTPDTSSANTVAHGQALSLQERLKRQQQEILNG